MLFDKSALRLFLHGNGLVFDDFFEKFTRYARKRQEQGDFDDVVRRVKHRKLRLRRVREDFFKNRGKGDASACRKAHDHADQKENHRAEDVEYKVNERNALRVRTSADGSKDRHDTRADIRAHHHV